MKTIQDLILFSGYSRFDIDLRRQDISLLASLGNEKLTKHLPNNEEIKFIFIT